MDARMKDVAMAVCRGLAAPETAALACSALAMMRPGAIPAAVKGARDLIQSVRKTGLIAGKSDEECCDCIDMPSSPMVMMRSDAPPNFWEREQTRRNEDIVPASQIAFMQYGNSGAFQEIDSSWDRPSAPNGPAGGDAKAKRPTGGKPDWYRIISDQDGRSSRPDGPRIKRMSDEEDEEISRVTDDELSSSEDRGYPWEDRSLSRARNVRNAALSRDLNYSDYLKLDRLLNCQETQSGRWDEEEHDEMLFIIIHQTYELWFKQILYELDSVMNMFKSERGVLKGNQISVCGHRLGRVTKILRVLVQQFDILETMEAQAFHDFREFLSPASGFQSKQFRLLENTMGLSPSQRIQHSGCPYFQHLREEDRHDVVEREDGPSLLCYVGKWLEAILDSYECEEFKFVDYMKSAIQVAAEHDKAAIHHYRLKNKMGIAHENQQNEELQKKLQAHLKLFSEEAHQELIEKGIRQLSFKATMGCVFVHSFRKEQPLAGVHRVLTHLVEMDELLAQWRQRHSQIVLRMIGSKSGTGGSSGHAYLTQVLARSRIFVDLCHSMHYLLPQHSLPELPPAVQRRVSGADSPCHE